MSKTLNSSFETTAFHILFYNMHMKIYDYTNYPFLDMNEKLIINMNSAILTFHTEKDILSFRNSHLNWLLLYDLKLNDEDYMHARMAFNAYGDLVSVQSSISDHALNNLITIADFCHGNILMDVRHSIHPDQDVQRAYNAGIRYVTGAVYPGMITCTCESVHPESSDQEENI